MLQKLSASDRFAPEKPRSHNAIGRIAIGSDLKSLRGKFKKYLTCSVTLDNFIYVELIAMTDVLTDRCSELINETKRNLRCGDSYELKSRRVS